MLCPNGMWVTSWSNPAIRMTRASSSPIAIPRAGSMSNERLIASIIRWATWTVPIEWSKRVCSAPGKTR